MLKKVMLTKKLPHWLGVRLAFGRLCLFYLVGPFHTRQDFRNAYFLHSFPYKLNLSFVVYLQTERLVSEEHQ